MSILSILFPKRIITLNDIWDGKYNYRKLSKTEVESVCTEIAKDIIADINGNTDFYNEFKTENKSVKNEWYLSLIYYCCAQFLDSLGTERFSPKQLDSIHYFGISLLDFIKKYEKKNPIDGGVDVWTRRGDCYLNIGEYKEAVNIYFEGLTILKKGMNWKSGKLSKNDILLSLDRSKVEIMLSRIVCATYLYQDYNICKQYGEQLLESIKIRGMNDLFSKELPKGVKFMVNESINPPKSTGLEKKIEDYWKGLDKPPF